jgi:hypothetical protein
MFVRTWKKGDKFFTSIVKSVRVGKKVSQETVVYLGEVQENQIPYLKAAYASSKPKLLYPNGTIYDG